MHKIYATVTIYYKKRGACGFFLVLHVGALNLKSIAAIFTSRHPIFISLIISLKVEVKISNLLILDKSAEMISYACKAIELWYEFEINKQCKKLKNIEISKFLYN